MLPVLKPNSAALGLKRHQFGSAVFPRSNYLFLQSLYNMIISWSIYPGVNLGIVASFSRLLGGEGGKPTLGFLWVYFIDLSINGSSCFVAFLCLTLIWISSRREKIFLFFAPSVQGNLSRGRKWYFQWQLLLMAAKNLSSVRQMKSLRVSDMLITPNVRLVIPTAHPVPLDHDSGSWMRVLKTNGVLMPRVQLG